MDPQSFFIGAIVGSIGAMSSQAVQQRWGNRGWWWSFASLVAAAGIGACVTW